MAEYEGFALVEIMGRTQVAGRISEVLIGGATMLRVDVPATPDCPEFTRYYGGSAIYSITPVSQEIAVRAAERLAVMPVPRWWMPVSAPALLEKIASAEDEHVVSASDYDDTYYGDSLDDEDEF